MYFLARESSSSSEICFEFPSSVKTENEDGKDFVEQPVQSKERISIIYILFILALALNAGGKELAD